MNISREIFTPGEFVRIPIRNPAYVLFFLSVSILHVEMLRVIVRGDFLPGLNCLENKPFGIRDFSVEE